MNRSWRAMLREVAITACGGVVICAAMMVYGGLKRSGLPARGLAEGDYLKLAGHDFSRHARWLLLATRPECGFCVASSAFHSRLMDAARGAGVPVLALVPDIRRAREKLTFLRGSSGFVKTDYADLHISGTPTLLVVDAHGQIVRAWVGQLPANQESQVIDCVIQRDPLPREVRVSELPALLERRDVSFLDLSLRTVPAAATRGWKRMPFDELEARAGVELAGREPIVLDCANVFADTCDLSASFLVSHRAGDVSLVDRGNKSPYLKCQNRK